MQTTKAFSKRAMYRGALPIAISITLLVVFGQGLLTFDGATVVQTVRQFSLQDWLLAAALTVISFAAVAQYDRIVAGWLDLDLPRRATLHAGWRATAISQVFGYGLITGALTRWRALGHTGLSLWECSRMTALASVAFFAGWGVITPLILLLSGNTVVSSLPIGALLGALLVGLAAGVLCLHPPKTVARWVPGVQSYVAAILSTAVDTAAAAAVIFIFLPEGYTTFLPFYAIFLVAFSAGMLSGLPAGLGAFEVTLIALLAPTDQAPLLSAILAYRLIYYAAPAILAAATLVVSRDAKEPSSTVKLSSLVPHDLALSAPPEADLMTQGQLQVASTNASSELAALWHRARHVDVMLGDPFGTDQLTLRPYQDAAGRADRALFLYKIGADCAEQAVRSGFFTACIGSEAILHPHAFTTEGSTFRQLRRKLKRAEKAGVSITDVPPLFADLQELDEAWKANNGHARGFSMGTLSRKLVSRQRVFTAERDGMPIAFLTMLIGADRWTLDLMRSGTDIPDGTMHALVAAALAEAKTENVPEVSLAACPMRLPEAPQTIAERLIHRLFTTSPQLQGLAQFKSCFAPRWEPRFMAIDRVSMLPLALHDIWFLINRAPHEDTSISQAHNHYALYEFDSQLTPCHALGRMTQQDPIDDAA